MTEPLLVVAAHPDDEVLGAGATMAKAAAAGTAVYVLILGEGETSRSADRDDADPLALVDLQDRASFAAAVLGVSEVVHGGLPDNRFDGVDLLDIVKIVEREVVRLSPGLVLTHHGGDLNIDHRRTLEAVLAATRPQPGSSIRSVRSFEVPSATDYAFGAVGGPFRATVYEQVDDFVAQKMAAIDCYDSEMRPEPHPRSAAQVERLLRVRGAEVGVGAAEAFELVWERR